MVEGDAVHDGMRPRSVVPDHSSECRTIAGRDIGWESPSGLLQMGVELVEDNSRFHAGEALLEIHIENTVHVFGEVDHDRGANSLSGQARSAPARQNRQTVP